MARPRGTTRLRMQDPSKGGAQISFLQADGNGYLPGAVEWRTVRDATADLPPPVEIEINDEASLLPLRLEGFQ